MRWDGVGSGTEGVVESLQEKRILIGGITETIWLRNQTVLTYIRTVLSVSVDHFRKFLKISLKRDDC